MNRLNKRNVGLSKRNVNLATTTNVTSSYSGQFAGEYIAAALLSSSTIDDGGLTIKANISYKEVIKKLATDDLVKTATCDFDPTSTITLTERVLEPLPLQINLSLCRADFVQDWESEQMGYGLGQQLPPKFSDFLIAHVSAEVAQNNELCIWRGDVAAGTNNSFDGFEKLIAAAATAGDIPAAQVVTGVTLTSANIIDEMTKVTNAIPNTLFGKEDLFVYVSSKAAKLYVAALGGFLAQGQGAAGVNNLGPTWYNNGSLMVNGVKVFVCPGMSDDKMYAAQRSNLYYGTGLMNNAQEVKVLDMTNLDGSDTIRMVMRFTSGVQFGTNDIVQYA
tara:strand:+ start:543 stop:1541 length:999 start_codon:yes stop_codon:yes gene_type:complete